MNRPFRPRPLDIYKKLPVVKSVKELDIDDSSHTSLSSNAVGTYRVIEPAQPLPTKRSLGEIPTPQFVVVDSYERDYLRTFAQPSSYVRGRGPRSDNTESVEYDLDNDDDDWLELLNTEEHVLSPERFEIMLYKLELLDYKARERAGAVPAVYGVPVPVYLQQEAVFEVLQAQATVKPAVLRAVFKYWKEKRELWQKPILRWLQPPPLVNDTNPFNVFRPREKTHRPHTRRTQRRENDVASFEKLRQVRCNLEQARVLLEVLQRRELKKRDLLAWEANLQRTQLTFKHDTNLEDELVMGESATSRSPFSNQGENGSARYTWRKRRVHFQANGGALKRVTTVDSLEPVFLFVKPLDLEKLAASGIVPPFSPSGSINSSGTLIPPYQCKGRIGRGGRIVFDRWNPISQTPIGCNNFSTFPSATSMS